MYTCIRAVNVLHFLGWDSKYDHTSHLFVTIVNFATRCFSLADHAGWSQYWRWRWECVAWSSNWPSRLDPTWYSSSDVLQALSNVALHVWSLWHSEYYETRRHFVSNMVWISCFIEHHCWFLIILTSLHCRYGMLDREEKVRTKTSRADKLEEEKNEQLKAAVKPKEVV